MNSHEQEILDLLLDNGEFDFSEIIKVTEIGDGNLNFVFRVIHKNANFPQSIIIKKSLPFLKVAGSSWSLTCDRNKSEYDTMSFENHHCAKYVPILYTINKEFHYFIMEDLGDKDTLRTSLMSGKVPLNLSENLGEYLAKSFYFTSDFGLTAKEKCQLTVKFMNPELCAITEQLVFTDPYISNSRNRYDKVISPVIRNLYNSVHIKRVVDKLHYAFMNSPESLIHGDLHTGSIFVCDNFCKVFDYEFSFYGPISYDIGVMFANIYFAYVWNIEKCNNNWRFATDIILNLIIDIWNVFCDNCRALIVGNKKSQFFSANDLIDNFLKRTLGLSIGYFSCEILRRIIGMAHVPEIDLMTEEHKNIVETLCIRNACDTLLSFDKYQNIGDFVQYLSDRTTKLKNV